MNAMVAEAYITLVISGKTTYNVLLSELKNTDSYKEMLIISNFNSEYIKTHNYNIDYNLLQNFFNDISNYMTLKNKKLNTSIYRIISNEKECQILLENWLQLFHKKGIYLKNKLIKVLNEFI